MNDHYTILEIPIDANLEEIKSQWRLMVQAWHPDKFQNPTQKAKAEEKVKKINEAYEVLSNPIKRKQYDLERNRSSSSEADRSHRKSQQDAAQHQKERERQQKEAEQERKRRDENERQSNRHKENEEQRQREYANAENVRLKREMQRKKLQRFIRITSYSFLIILLIIGISYFLYWNNIENHYQAGISALNAKNWGDARREFVSVKDYKDSNTLFLESYYQEGSEYFNSGLYDQAIDVFTQLSTLSNGFKDSASLIKESHKQKVLISISTRRANCPKSSCSPRQIIEYAFSGYLIGDVNLISQLMTTKGKSNSNRYCDGEAIICLNRNYKDAGYILDVETTLTSSSETSTEVQLTTKWSEESSLCQDYQLDYENGSWGITYFNVPSSCEL